MLHSVSTQGVLLAVVLILIQWSSSSSGPGLYDLVQGTDPLLHEILALAPSIQRGPNPPVFFSNRHLQFLPWLIQNMIHEKQGMPFQRIEITVTACVDKSQPNCIPSPEMNDIVTLDIFPPLQDVDSHYNQQFNDTSPIIFFAPGLRCYSQDLPGQMLMRKAYAEGFRSIVVNRRGHTPGVPLKSPRWSLFGDISDMEQVYWHVKNQLAGPNTAFFFHGISSGTAVTVTALSAWDERRARTNESTPSFVAAIAITPGYDTSKVMQPDRFTFPYNDILTPLVKDHFIIQNEAVLRQFNSDAVDAALNATSLQEIVDAAAPFAGYPNASEYYRAENPINEVRHISTPKLVLNSLDDPCCHIDNLYEASPYPHHEGYTFAEMVSQTQRGMVAVAKTGSHCPFLDCENKWFMPATRDPLFGGWMLSSWADQVAIEYYLAALKVYGDRRFL